MNLKDRQLLGTWRDRHVEGNVFVVENIVQDGYLATGTMTWGQYNEAHGLSRITPWSARTTALRQYYVKDDA